MIVDSPVYRQARKIFGRRDISRAMIEADVRDALLAGRGAKSRPWLDDIRDNVLCGSGLFVWNEDRTHVYEITREDDAIRVKRACRGE